MTTQRPSFPHRIRLYALVIAMLAILMLALTACGGASPSPTPAAGGASTELTPTGVETQIVEGEMSDEDAAATEEAEAAGAEEIPTAGSSEATAPPAGASANVDCQKVSDAILVISGFLITSMGLSSDQSYEALRGNPETAQNLTLFREATATFSELPEPTSGASAMTVADLTKMLNQIADLQEENLQSSAPFTESGGKGQELQDLVVNNTYSITQSLQSIASGAGCE